MKQFLINLWDSVRIEIVFVENGYRSKCWLAAKSFAGAIVMTLFRGAITDAHNCGFKNGRDFERYASRPSRDSKGRFKGKGQ